MAELDAMHEGRSHEFGESSHAELERVLHSIREASPHVAVVSLGLVEAATIRTCHAKGPLSSHLERRLSSVSSSPALDAARRRTVVVAHVGPSASEYEAYLRICGSVGVREVLAAGLRLGEREAAVTLFNFRVGAVRSVTLREDARSVERAFSEGSLRDVMRGPDARHRVQR